MKRIVLLFIAVFGISCGHADDDPWELSKDIPITAYKGDPENGKQYLEVIYENASKFNIRKLKIEIIERTGSKFDTIMKEITPEQILHPKDRHLAKRPVGEPVATFDEVKVGRVWIVKE